MTSDASSTPGETASFAAVVPALDEQDRIAATVAALAALEAVDLVVVVDDGSTDATRTAAESAGALVARHERTRGKAAALETGAALVAAIDAREGTSRNLLLADADLGASATRLEPLLAPVAEGELDLAIGVLPPQVRPDGGSAGGHGFVVRLARDGIRTVSGWEPRQPLSGQRAMTRAAFDAALPLAPGFGVEAGMTVDLLRGRFRVAELDVDVAHRATGNDWRGQLHRAKQWRDVARALAARGALPPRAGLREDLVPARLRRLGR
ncbi:glycosyl transferase family 2 [Motilibacter peucedani]|uniref:Glucosyl-3-phosphoglycerate synthase n=1 Tax=Motilibacter peucedani TaxID=598650 RepID=A0A420XTZ8_9ACTN|nr:glycosyltransferase [Motilibacter peucedani]RKS80294.1 glycosyl transferase family 2 [Motilibacter peucedani]